MEQISKAEPKQCKPCINDDEECSWSGDEGCLCYPTEDKWVPVVLSKEDGEERHHLKDFWSFLEKEGGGDKEAFYVPKTIKLLINGDVKEVPIEWLLRKHVEVPEDFGKGHGKIAPDCPGEGLTRLNAMIDAEMTRNEQVGIWKSDFEAREAKGYESRDRSAAIFNKDSGDIETRPLKEVLESSIMYEEDDEEKE